MNHLSDEQQRELRKKLEEKKAELVDQLSRIATKNPAAGEGNWKATFEDMGEEWDDKVHEVTEHDIKTSLEQSLEIHLKKVNAALERIERGTYGVCETGGEPIPAERLMVAPETTQCQEHAKN